MSANTGEPRKRGRPSDYQEEYALQAERLCRLIGATDKQLAEFFGKSESTIANWKNEHPEFLEAIKRGKLIADMNVNDSLYKRGTFHEYTEQQAIKVREVVYGDNGKKLKEIERVELVEVKRVLAPCTTAMIFWHKNRQPEHWRDKREIEVTDVSIADQLEKARRRAKAQDDGEPINDRPI